MADMEDVHRVPLDTEQYPVKVWPTAVKKLPHFERNPFNAKTLLHSEFVQELLSRTMPSRPHIFLAALDASDGFLEVAYFALEEGG